MHPLFILWRSRWACAQKSMQAVTPPKGRPGWLPRRQSEASFSNLVWLCQDTGAILLYRGDKSVANPCSRSSTSSSYKQPHVTLLVWIHDPDGRWIVMEAAPDLKWLFFKICENNLETRCVKKGNIFIFPSSRKKINCAKHYNLNFKKCEKLVLILETVF